MKELEMLQDALNELGIPVTHKKTEETPRYYTYHFDLPKLIYMDGLERKVKFISAYLHKEVQYVKSEIAYFALRIPKQNITKFKMDKESFGDLYYNSFKKVAEPNGTNLFLGIDDASKPVIVDLKEMPHILIAGTTGSGKSMLLHSIMCSFLTQYHNANFLLFDTKRIELTRYDNGEYMETEKDALWATKVLKGLCMEMDERYEEMDKLGVTKQPKHMPDIIVVIDEFADLVMTDKSVEDSIVRLAQLGRGCGIHLIIATQHPVVSILTGKIKANISCRIALKTASAMDSVCILGHKGAEQLQGKGDAILKLPTQEKEIHIQCPYISDESIKEMVKDYNE